MEILLSFLFGLIFVIGFSALLLSPIVIVIVLFIAFNKKYKSSTYYQATKLPYLAVRSDIGRYGEYLTYKHLKFLEADNVKFLFNVYIPKSNGQTTECDVMLICKKGIFVFESKNYSGWIFGNEDQNNWYQTLPTGRGRSKKTVFYNPIMQNRNHIKHLKSLLNREVPIYSVIVFSDRCTFKNIRKHSSDIYIIHRSDITKAVADVVNNISQTCLTDDEIFEIYNALFPYSQVDNETKNQHIENIKKSTTAKTIQPTKTTPKLEEIDVLNENCEYFCPKCNGKLVLRTASKGTHTGNKFWGCSNYPKCKFTKFL